MNRQDLTRRRHVDLARVSSASCCCRAWATATDPFRVATPPLLQPPDRPGPGLSPRLWHAAAGPRPAAVPCHPPFAHDGL